MSKNYDLIATVNVSITSPVVDSSSFGNLLIVGPAPAGNAGTPDDVASYSSIGEVERAGWVSTGDNADPVGIAARVAFSQTPKPAMIYIAPIKKDDEGTDEKAVDAVKRAIDNTGWYVVCPAGVDESEYEDIAGYIDSTNRKFVYTDLNILTTKKPPIAVSHVNATGIYGRVFASQPEDELPAENEFINVAFMATVLGYQSGTETAAFKKLTSVTPSKLSADDIKVLVENNTNYFIEIGNRGVTMGGKTIGGEWFDVVRFRDWQLNDMQVRIVNLFISNPKIELTDAGIALIENQMLASLKSGQDIGGIAKDEYNADGETIPGYTTSVPQASELTDEQKASRDLSGFTFKARLSGAIHHVEVDGSLAYSL